MNQIVLASHGDMAKGMKHTIEMIFGPQDNLHWLSTLSPPYVFHNVVIVIDVMVI